MKMKSFAILAITGCLLAWFSYAVPAIADDATYSAPSEPAAHSNNTNTDNADNTDTSNLNNTDNTDNAVANQMNNDDNTSTMDQGVPDTATGDDY